MEYLEVATEIARRGGDVLKKYWEKDHDIRNKVEAGNLVTEADEMSEELILDLIRQHYPTHSILSEETGAHGLPDAEYLWIVDPLDGTTNYAHHYPVFSVSIALLHYGKTIVGVVYNPILEELFQVALGAGATLNGNEIHVSKVNALNNSLLATGFAYNRRDTSDNNYAEFYQLTQTTHGVRRGGAATIDLAYVAAGRLDGFWERGLKPWDVAAGALLVEEAGGCVSAYDLSHLQLHEEEILATNGTIHEEMSQTIQKIRVDKGY